MAHSIQTYKGKAEVINDLDLLIIIGFALQAIHRSMPSASLQSLAEQWQQAIRQYGPGIIDLKIEQFVQSPDNALELAALFEIIANGASQYTKTIPADMLNKQLSVPGVTFYDYEVSSIKEALKRLQTLITES